jgi:hypothetical protein
MAVTLLFQQTTVELGSLTLDASLSESHQKDAEVTEHPVELGADISDHFRPKQDQLQIEGVVSNTPLRGTADSARAQTAYETLVRLRKTGQMLTVVTPLESYENMALISLVVPRDPKLGEVLKFTASLKQVTIVQSQRVKIVGPRSSKSSEGNKPTTEAPQKASSALYRGTKAAQASKGGTLDAAKAAVKAALGVH